MESEFMASRPDTDGSPVAAQILSAPLIFKGLLTNPASPPVRWEKFRPGIEISRLYSAGEDGPTAAFLRYQPGARLDRHRHGGYEHILVLSGSQTDDSGEHPAGTLLVHPPGTSHAIKSVHGCVVLAIWEKPAIFDVE